jgi:multidrug efflux pump
VLADTKVQELRAWVEQAGLDPRIEVEFRGEDEEQAEAAAFLMQAFGVALFLIAIILVTQFNSFYSAFLILTAVIMSTIGVMIGLIVTGQPFGIVMTGIGVIALAGIVVNNNIILIDTYQEYARFMPRIEAIVRTAETRIRPVLLTTLTTMAGLTPMMFGLSLDFVRGGATLNSPTALWWTQLATAVVFGLGIATVLTLIFTPSMLALRVWAGTYVSAFAEFLERMTLGRSSQAVRDWELRRRARKVKAPEIIWDIETGTEARQQAEDGSGSRLRAAE